MDNKADRNNETRGAGSMSNTDLDRQIDRYMAKRKLLGLGEFVIRNKKGNIILVRALDVIGNEVIPDFVTHIGDGAFENCSGLQNIELHDNIKYI